MLVPSLTTPSSAQPARIPASARHRSAIGCLQYEPRAGKREAPRRAARPIRPGCTNASLASAPAGRVVATRTRNSNAAVASRPRGAGGGLRLVLELGVDHIVLAVPRSEEHTHELQSSYVL